MRGQQAWFGLRGWSRAGLRSCLPVLVCPLFSVSLFAQQVLQRGNATVVVEPYAANIVRVTLSLRREDALAAPGPGILGARVGCGMDERQRHARVTPCNQPGCASAVRPQGPPSSQTGTQADIAKFFGGSTPYVGLQIQTADGRDLVDLQGWQMAVPNYKDGTAWLANDRRPTRSAVLHRRRELQRGRRRARLRHGPESGGLPRSPRPRAALRP